MLWHILALGAIPALNWSNQNDLVAENCKDWLLDCGDEVSHKCFHWAIQGQASSADDRQHAVDFCLLFCFRPVVKITDTVSLSLLPSVLSCTVQILDLVLKAKLFRLKFSWSPNCSCDYRQIDTLWCPQPARPAGTGNDAIHAALTLTGPREATASLTRKMLSISSAGWLCPVIVMLARLWHLCYVDGKCLSNHLLAAQFEFSSTLMDSSWRIIIKKMKSSLTLNATAAATPWRRPTVPVTKAVDGRTASPPGLLPFSCCVAAQRLNLMTFLIVVERPGDRPRPFSDLTTHPLPSPLPRKWCLYPCRRIAAL